MSDRYDALVAGGGVGGLTAASLLAKAGLKTLLLERSAILFAGNGDATLRALDPRVVKELKLAKHGLKFAVRDLPLAIPRTGAAPTILSRDRHATAKSLAALSPADAESYAAFRTEMFALARALRPVWWDGRPASEIAPRLKPVQRALLEQLSVSSTLAFLAARFESDALRAALAFTAAECGAPPSEPGSALALGWAAAQEMSGAQGAVALPQGGTGGLLHALSEAAQKSGAEIRTAATVLSLMTNAGAVTGIELTSGEKIEAPLVLSALPRRRTLGRMLPAAALGLGATAALARPTDDVGAATLTFMASAAPSLAALVDSRAVIAERGETYETALAAIRLGRLPSEFALDLVQPPREPGPPQAAARVTLVARAWPCPPVYDRAALVQAVTIAIERHAPGFAATVLTCDVIEPQLTVPATVARLLEGSASRIATPIAGLFLCGEDAEPANAISGRAARQAVRLAIAHLREERAP
jgi:phytoene dehydrogenase-like protein